jgi:hypothetical protein
MQPDFDQGQGVVLPWRSSGATERKISRFSG